MENYKGFSRRLTWDLTARDYSFNSSLVQNGIVNKAIIYGKNGIGKTCLGLALFDLTIHLTDKMRMNPAYLNNYRNLTSLEKPAVFIYTFQFDRTEMIYEYQKMDPDFLICEKLTINGRVVIDYDYFTPEKRYIDPRVQGSLNIDLVDNKLSVIKYIYRNQNSGENPEIAEMMQFCENMLWYRSLSDGNTYAGYTNGRTTLAESLYQSGKLREFQSFLLENGMNYQLAFESVNGKHELFAVFQDGKQVNKAPFESIASTGTLALFLFFHWEISSFKNLSFLFIDEFDAFLHYESSEYIIKKLNQGRNFQSAVTTHNTYLMNNRLTRPDCCFIMTNNKISSLKNATPRELREGHNLEKLFLSGEFGE
ncbi:MAG: ATP-binding protein [Clostridia bacterium]|nr:ATP-binding protein [Clostridia bacterium]